MMANKAVQRTRTVSGLPIDELSTTFRDWKLFLQLDMNNGFHEMKIDWERKKYVVETTKEN